MNETVEIRPIPGHLRYGASGDGRIWSRSRGPWRQLATSLDSSGRPKVNITGGKTFLVHTLVALTFLGARPAKYDIDHKDGNQQNCAVSNLEYCTRSQNMTRAIKAARQPRSAATFRGFKCTRTTRKGRVHLERRRAGAIELGIRQIPKHPNYGVTVDGQAWSFAKRQTWRKLVHVSDSRGLPKVKIGKRRTGWCTTWWRGCSMGRVRVVPSSSISTGSAGTPRPAISGMSASQPTTYWPGRKDLRALDGIRAELGYEPTAMINGGRMVHTLRARPEMNRNSVGNLLGKRIVQGAS